MMVRLARQISCESCLRASVCLACRVFGNNNSCCARRILEEDLFPGIVTWNTRGDCFVIKDVGEFTKSILPRMFKHSNFASFVRQLNKYDFHKVSNNHSSFTYSWRGAREFSHLLICCVKDFFSL